MIEFLHDVNFLIDVLLEEGFLFNVLLADNLDGIVGVRGT